MRKKKKRYQSISSVVCKGLESEILDRRYFIDVSAFVECPETLITICAKKRRNCAKMNILETIGTIVLQVVIFKFEI